jgi:hypothetical protein
MIGIRGIRKRVFSAPFIERCNVVLCIRWLLVTLHDAAFLGGVGFRP